MERKTRITYILCLLLLLLSARSGLADNVYYSLNTQDGLSSNNVYQMLQLSDGRLLYTKAAYGPDEMELYSRTSLIVKDSEHTFYQIRTHGKHSVLQTFDTKSRSWRRLLTSDDCLHTLIVTPNDVAYVTTPDGYISINLNTGEQHSHKELRLTDGTLLDTGINTVCQDREGSIWLGTYDKGLLYLSPLSGLFDTRPIDMAASPPNMPRKSYKTDSFSTFVLFISTFVLQGYQVILLPLQAEISKYV